MDNKEKVMQFISMRGPVLPVNVAKHIEQPLLISSAILSELVSSGKLKLSSLKVGSSPVYYVPGQEERVQQFSKNLNEKDRRTFTLLKEKKILWDKKQEPLIRVSLRNIKDFAVPLEVNINDNKELFWKLHTLKNEEIEVLIKKELGIKESPKEKQTEKSGQDVQKKIQTQKQGLEKKESSKDKSGKTEEQIKETQKNTKERQKENKQTEKSNIDSEKEKSKIIPENNKDQDKVNNQKTIQELKSFEKIEDEFAQKVSSFFSRSDIRIIEHSILKKGKEVDFLVALPSAVGEITYYCKAKNKKRLNESDISLVYAQGQMKKLPALLVTPGDLTKKAQEMLNSQEFKQLKVKKI